MSRPGGVAPVPVTHVDEDEGRDHQESGNEGEVLES